MMLNILLDTPVLSCALKGHHITIDPRKPMARVCCENSATLSSGYKQKARNTALASQLEINFNTVSSRPIYKTWIKLERAQR